MIQKKTASACEAGRSGSLARSKKRRWTATAGSATTWFAWSITVKRKRSSPFASSLDAMSGMIAEEPIGLPQPPGKGEGVGGALGPAAQAASQNAASKAMLERKERWGRLTAPQRYSPRPEAAGPRVAGCTLRPRPAGLKPSVPAISGDPVTGFRRLVLASIITPYLLLLVGAGVGAFGARPGCPGLPLS